MTKRRRRKPLQAIPLEAPVIIEAAGDIEGEHRPARFDVVAYTGGPLTVPRYDRPVVIDLQGLQFRNSLVANLDHDNTKRVGHVTDRQVENGSLRLSGVASAATAARNEVVASAAEGFTWQASVEALPHKLESLAAGKVTSVNGQSIRGPAYIARAATLKGFAFVSHGADDATQVTIAAEAAEGREMDEKLYAFIEAAGFDPDSLTDTQVEHFRKNFQGQSTPPRATDPDPEIDAGGGFPELERRKRDAAKRKRFAQIGEIYAEDYPDEIEEIQACCERGLKAGWTVEQLELQLMRLTRPQAKPTIGRRKKRNIEGRVIEAAICLVGSLPNIESHFDEETLELADENFRGGIGLQQIIARAAKANGWDGDDVRSDLRGALRHAFPPVEAAGFSTITLPNVFSNTANKFLLDGFNAVDSTWSRISSRRNARDFKTMTSISLTGDFQYVKLPPGGEIEHGTPGELTYTNKVDTYARMLSITRTDIVNDDLDALSAVPRRLGRGAALKVNDVFWTAFLNNTSFWTAGNGSFSDGAATALSSSALSSAEVLFANQTDPDSKPLGLMPSILLVPPTQKTTAMELMNSAFLITGSDTTRPSGNVFQGRFRVESSPYMENSSYTGNSTLKWYLLANPSELSAVEVAFLNGREAPTVDSTDADFNTLGVQMRGYHDFGVAMQEYRAGVAMKGEA